MKVKVYNQEGLEAGHEADLNPRIFSIEKVKPELVHLVATAIRSNMRQSVASTKTKGEVRGGGKKPWKQKGTGRARAGSIRSPLWRGGGITFGPRPNRNFYKKVNRKSRRLGIFSVLSDKAQDGRIVVIENLEIEEPKTKKFLEKFKNFAALLKGRKVILILPQKQEDLMKAAQNLKNVRISLADNLNILDLLWADTLVIYKDALEVLEKTYLAAEKHKDEKT